VQSPEQLLSCLAEDRLGVPSLNQEKGVDTRPVGRRLQIPIHVGDIPPTPLQAMVTTSKRKYVKWCQ
jgi:hypothetical protein